jgi:hypothetical protein
MAQYERTTHMNSVGQIKHQAIMEERRRLNFVVQTQMDDLKLRIANSNNDFIKQAWTIALLELTEVQRMTNYPMKETA